MVPNVLHEYDEFVRHGPRMGQGWGKDGAGGRREWGLAKEGEAEADVEVEEEEEVEDGRGILRCSM
jgi:hypothetical protein